mmetsp:Transcript_24647/g.68701  ORF Transcript_24647/g.68701 Transcript_24647/m.68701 type:complete len:86 (-) Transcript_24647:120-377(-)
MTAESTTTAAMSAMRVFCNPLDERKASNGSIRPMQTDLPAAHNVRPNNSNNDDDGGGEDKNSSSNRNRAGQTVHHRRSLASVACL